MADRRAELAELRATLHRAADLFADLIGHVSTAPHPKRRRAAGGEIQVDDLSRKRAENTLVKLGWPLPPKKGPTK